MKRVYVFLCLLMVGCFAAWAQTPPEAKTDAKPAAKDRGARAGKDKAAKKQKAGGKDDAAKGKNKEGEGEKAPPAAPEVELKGDVISLKSGAQLKGVQVVSRSPNQVEVDVGGGVIMPIPRKLISDIKFDDIEPGKTPPGGAAAAAQKESSIIPGSKLKPEVQEKLTKPLPEPPLKYENADLVTVLADLSQKLGVTIDVDEAVKALPPNERLWTFETKPGMNLMGLLQDDLLKKLSNLAVVYQYDKLLVTTTERAKEIASKEAAQAPASPAPPAAPVAPPAAPVAPPAAPGAPAPDPVAPAPDPAPAPAPVAPAPPAPPAAP